MSEIKRIIEIETPLDQTKKEFKISKSHVCGYCHGSGFIDSIVDDGNICPVCEGTGMMDAYISIEWKPVKY